MYGNLAYKYNPSCICIFFLYGLLYRMLPGYLSCWDVFLLNLKGEERNFMRSVLSYNSLFIVPVFVLGHSKIRVHTKFKLLNFTIIDFFFHIHYIKVIFLKVWRVNEDSNLGTCTKITIPKFQIIHQNSNQNSYVVSAAISEDLDWYQRQI